MIKTVSINFRPDDKHSIDIIKNVCSILSEKKINIQLPDYPENLQKELNEFIINKNELTSDPDLAIAIGGDGTFLKTARLFIDSRCPVLGINRGKLGFLTEFNPDEYEKYLYNILDGR